MNLHDLFLYIFFYFLSSGENERYEDDVLQLMPAADELSVQLLREKLIKAASIPYSSNTDSILIWVNDKLCKGCGRYIRATLLECDYYLCGSCVMKPRVVKHPWDPHPLCLIYEPGMVIDHEHDFNCEFCSEDIDSNFWFYHCGTCDLSFHLKCFEKSSYLHYSNVKFGATSITIDKIHQHNLKFVLNKKFRKCEKCQKNQLGEPVLECAGECRSIFCISCAEMQ